MCVYPPISIYHWLRMALRNSLNALPCSIGRVCTFFCAEEVLRKKVTGASRRQALGALCGGDMGRSPTYPLWIWTVKERGMKAEAQAVGLEN